ncbi:hypothetical protein N7467_005245 [Penicillium canescens]|nr:hypothetical protein N7467_005245 [Penicillium canescens]
MSNGRKPTKSRNIALMSIFGVIGGTWLMFRFLAPQRSTFITRNEEMAAFRGGNSMQTDQGDRPAMPSRNGYQVPRGTV